MSEHLKLIEDYGNACFECGEIGPDGPYGDYLAKQRSTREALIGYIEMLLERAGVGERAISESRDYAQHLRVEREKLHAALRILVEHAAHAVGCNYYTDGPCSCGLDTTLDALS